MAILAIVEWQKNCPIVPLPGCTFSHHLIGKWIPGKGMIIKIVPNGNMQSSSCLKIFENQIRVYLLQCHTSYCFSKVLMHRYERDNRQRKKKSMKMQTVENEMIFRYVHLLLIFLWIIGELIYTCKMIQPGIFFQVQSTCTFLQVQTW